MNRSQEDQLLPASAEPTASTRERRGVALLAALLAVVVISVLVVGGLFASTQEYRGGRNLLAEQRAFSVAEFGLNKEVSEWDRLGTIKMPVGSTLTNEHPVAMDGDRAFVTITKLTPNTFWVVSEGYADLGSGGMESARRTNAFVRLAYPSINPEGAITTAGALETKGNFKVTGENTNPPNWGSMCDDIPDEDVAAIRHAPGVTIKIHKAQNVIGGVVADEKAADPETYIRYGSETWETLVANADIVLAPGEGKLKPSPVGTDSTCTYSKTNWGEPDRPGVVGCQHYFPIIYAEGDVHLNANSKGQGILLVNGNIKLNGGFRWHGIIIARDNVDTGNGNADIYGAIYARDAELGGSSYFSGNQDVFYSRCAIENALRGSAILTRVRHRHWTQLF